MDAITNPCPNLSQTMLVEGVREVNKFCKLVYQLSRSHIDKYQIHAGIQRELY